MTHRRTRMLATSAVVLMLILTASAMGCVKQAAKTAENVSATEIEATKQVCITNMQTAQAEVVSFYMQNPGARPPMQVEVLVQQGALKAAPVCPAGGKYTFNPNDSSFSCSVHGLPPE